MLRARMLPKPSRHWWRWLRINLMRSETAMTDNETRRFPDILQVLPISPGIALGPVLLLKSVSEPGGYARKIEKEQVAHERQRLQEALDAAEGEIDELYKQVARTVGLAEAEIFSAQKLMLRDPDLLEAVEALMKIG